MKRTHEEDHGVDLHELLRKLDALSLVVKSEIPHVLDHDVKVPASFVAPPVKRGKKS